MGTPIYKREMSSATQALTTTRQSCKTRAVWMPAATAISLCLSRTLTRQEYTARQSVAGSSKMGLTMVVQLILLQPGCIQLCQTKLGATIRPPRRLVMSFMRWQPAAQAMCGRRDTSIPLTILLPTSIQVVDGQSIRPLHKAATIPFLALRQE